MLDLVIPDECIPFIRLQRSKFQERREVDLVNGFREDVEADWNEILPYLPEVELVDDVLEIGCGVGALSVLLQRHFQPAYLMLLDGDGAESNGGGFVKDCPPYNSRAATEALLRANGVQNWEWIPVGFKGRIHSEFTVSLASWGYHYPLSTYSVQGPCIADLRRGHQATLGTVIRKGPKYDRCAFELR